MPDEPKPDDIVLLDGPVPANEPLPGFEEPAWTAEEEPKWTKETPPPSGSGEPSAAEKPPKPQKQKKIRQPKQPKPPKPPKQPKASGEKKQGQKGLLGGLRRLMKYRVAISLLKKSKELSQGAGESLADPTQEGFGPDAAAPKAKAPARKKGKKEKPPKTPGAKKAKKTKAPKAKKTPKAPKAKDGGKNNKKLLIIIVGAVVALAGGATAAIVLTRSMAPTPQELLDAANALAAGGAYPEAAEAFERVIETGDLLSQAYLGAAEALVSQEDIEGGIAKLREGIAALPGDTVLPARLDELQNPPDPDAPPPIPVEPIVWEDAAFEKMVRLAIGKPAGDISEADIAGITTLRILGNTHAIAVGGEYAANTPEERAIDTALKFRDGYEIDGVRHTGRGDITTLRDAAHFRSLTSLSVGYNRVSDLSGLETTKLTTLGVYANELTDLAPLRELAGLRHLYAYNNLIGDLSGLEGKNELITLALQYNDVSDLTPLRGLPSLHQLLLRDNRVEDLSPLAGLPSLTILYIENNAVASIGPVADMPALNALRIMGNPVLDLSPAAHVPNINKP